MGSCPADRPVAQPVSGLECFDEGRPGRPPRGREARIRARLRSMSALRVAVLRRLYRVAWRLLQLRSLVWLRPGRGVKCVLTSRGQVLLVRHTYGQRHTWYIPGGAARRGEPPLRAAARELEEELGLRDLALRELATRDMRLERLSVRLTCLHAELADSTPLRVDPVEIAEARWFPIGDLPLMRGAEVAPLLALLDGDVES
jgi:8-oxo-dGTP pyrophosphatase MutT (NUDIX family)